MRAVPTPPWAASDARRTARSAAGKLTLFSQKDHPGHCGARLDRHEGGGSETLTASDQTRTRANAVITVHNYEPAAYDEPAAGPVLTRIHLEERFSGDISDDGVVEFLQAARADGSASFVGIERVTGTVAGRTGTFLLQDGGTVQDNIVSGDWFVIPGVGHRQAGRTARHRRFPRQPRRGRPGPPGLLVRMTRTVPGRDGGAGRALPQSGPAAPVTMVLSREVRAGHEGAFEDVPRRLAAEISRQPGHLDATVLRPPPVGRRIYTIVSHFASRADADPWLANPARARLVAEAGLHAAGELPTRYLAGLEGWLAAPGAPVLVPPARWKTALVSAAGIMPLLEAVSYLLAPRLAGLPVWARRSCGPRGTRRQARGRY
jgi:antibiotic biosynthesis monooxygenase (ABM) superfamily enzyme